MKNIVFLFVFFLLFHDNSISFCQNYHSKSDSLIIDESEQGYTEYYFVDYKNAQELFHSQCNNAEIYRYSTMSLIIENEKELSSKGYLNMIKGCLSEGSYNFLRNQKRYIIGFGLIIGSDGRIIARSVVEKPVLWQNAKINKLTPAEINCLLEFSKSLNFSYQYQRKLSIPFLIKYTYYLGKIKPN